MESSRAHHHVLLLAPRHTLISDTFCGLFWRTVASHPLACPDRTRNHFSHGCTCVFFCLLRISLSFWTGCMARSGQPSRRSHCDTQRRCRLSERPSQPCYAVQCVQHHYLRPWYHLSLVLSDLCLLTCCAPRRRTVGTVLFVTFPGPPSQPIGHPALS
jgi:hypothetical protein